MGSDETLEREKERPEIVADEEEVTARAIVATKEASSPSFFLFFLVPEAGIFLFSSLPFVFVICDLCCFSVLYMIK